MRWGFVRLAQSASPGIPSQTRYHVLDSKKLKSLFGVGKIQSTRLQAATRRIAEQFLVYEAMEQALLEHEEQRDFGRIVEVDEETIRSLDRKNIAELRRFLFRRYTLPAEGLKQYVEGAELVPHDFQAQQAPQDVRNRLWKLLSAERPALSEIAACLADSPTPDINTFKMAINRLTRRGYLGPAQVVLDNLVISRMQLDSDLLVTALDLATISGNRKLFLSYSHIGPGEDVALAKRFGVERELPESALVAIAQGAVKFREANTLTKALQMNTKSLKLHALNIGAAARWKDKERLEWSKTHLPIGWRRLAPSDLVNEVSGALTKAEELLNGT